MPRKFIRWAIYIIGIVFLLLLPFVLKTSYLLGVANMAIIMAIASLGLNISKGYLGLFNVAHAGIWGLGAYTAGFLAVKMGCPFIVTVTAAVAVASLGGLCLGVVSLKLKGIYFTVLTIGFTIMVQMSANNWDAVTNGASGLGGIPLPDFGLFLITSRVQMYFVLLITVALVIWFCIRLEKSKYGRAMKAIQSHEIATELMGVNTFYDKTLGLVLSSAIGGLSGALLAHSQGFIAPVQFGFEQAVMFVVALVAGGLGSVPGAIMGSVLFTFLPEFTRPLRYWSTTIYGLLVMIVILIYPGGLISIIQKIPFLSWLFSKEQKLYRSFSSSSSQGSKTTSNNKVEKLTEPVLKVQNLGISFGGLTALKNINMELLPGQVHALIGPNGAGKTTLVNCITGAYQPGGGSILLSGTSILGLRPYQISRLGISRTFQNLAVWKELTVLDNLLVAKRAEQTKGFWSVIFGTKGARLEEENAIREAREHLCAMNLWEESDRKIGTIPYGHQKIFEISRALMTEPKVLLLDEPAAGLTYSEVIQLKELINQIKSQGIAILLIEHNIQLVMDIADNITVLDYGQVIASGNPDIVRNDPGVIKAYLGVENLTKKREVKINV